MSNKKRPQRERAKCLQCPRIITIGETTGVGPYCDRCADVYGDRSMHRSRGTRTIAALVLLLALGACGNIELPSKSFAISTTPDLEPDLDAALVGWERVGLYRVGENDSPDIATFRLERWPTDDLAADGVSHRIERIAYVKHSLAGLRLRTILAHETGHIVLDTSNHNPTGCGIMGGADVFPCDEDYALACDRVEVGCAGPQR